MFGELYLLQKNFCQLSAFNCVFLPIGGLFRWQNGKRPMSQKNNKRTRRPTAKVQLNAVQSNLQPTVVHFDPWCGNNPEGYLLPPTHWITSGSELEFRSGYWFVIHISLTCSISPTPNFILPSFWIRNSQSWANAFSYNKSTSQNV